VFLQSLYYKKSRELTAVANKESIASFHSLGHSKKKTKDFQTRKYGQGELGLKAKAQEGRGKVWLILGSKRGKGKRGKSTWTNPKERP